MIPPEQAASSAPRPCPSPASRALTRRSLAPLALGLAPLVLSACGAGSGTSSPSPSTGSAATSGGPQGGAGGTGGTGGTAGTGASPGTGGTGGPSSPAGAGATATGSGTPGDPSTQASPTPLTEQENTAAGALDWGEGAQGRQASGDAALIITDLRVGAHADAGYDRLVVELSGQGSPGWLAPRWVEEASTTGKGDPIEVQGRHILVVTGTGAVGAPDEEQQARMYSGPRDLGLSGRGIGSAHVDMPFESEFQVVVGTSTQDYRVFALDGPARLVIDVAHQQG